MTDKRSANHSMRIYELSRMYRVSTLEALDEVRRLGISARNYMTKISPEEKERAARHFDAQYEKRPPPRARSPSETRVVHGSIERSRNEPETSLHGAGQQAHCPRAQSR